MTTTRWPIHPDAETYCLIQLLDRGGWAPHEISQIERAIRDRRAQIEGGVSSIFAKRWTDKLQKEVDKRLRLRWDFKNGWVLDRFAQDMWQVAGVFGFNYIRPYLVDYLRENDMQRWPSPEAYLKYKREKAMKVAMENEYRSTQKVLAAVDKMSDKRIREYISTERALQTGERVTLHGASEKMMTTIQKSAAKSPINRSTAINPGQNPFVYKRKTGGKHIRENR